MNQDGRFGPEDLALAEQSVAGELGLAFEAIDAGDLDLSGTLDARDVELMRQALQGSAVLPSALLDAYAYPGGVVAVVSPSLLDPDAEAEVFVDGEASPDVMRAILGYATFVVPASLGAEDADVVVDVVVEVDGAVAEQLALRIAPSPPAPSVSAKEDVLAFLSELSRIVASQGDAGAAFLEEIGARSGGLSDDDAAVVLSATTAAALQLDSAIAELEAILDSEDGEQLAELLQRALYANGLQEFRERAASLAPQSSLSGSLGALSGRASNAAEAPDFARVCGKVVPTICFLKTGVELLPLVSSVATAMCTLSSLSSVATLNPAVITVVTSVCAKTLVALKLSELLGVFVEGLSLDMRLSSDRTTLQPHERATITAEVTFAGLRDICNQLNDFGGKHFALYGLKRLTKRLLRKSPELAFIQKMLEPFQGEEAFLSYLESIVGTTLSVTKLDRGITWVAEFLCDLASGGATHDSRSRGLVADAREFNLQLQEPDGGRLSPRLDDNETYTGRFELACAAGYSGTVVVKGSKEMCGKEKRDELTVSCGDPCPGAADGEVDIPDAGLRAAVEEALGKLGKPPGAPIVRYQMASLGSLNARNRGIGSLVGLECATALIELELINNSISDVSPLAGLTALELLGLDGNEISDVSPLVGLTALKRLGLSVNSISDVSPLSGLTELQSLNLEQNSISDASPLAGLTALEALSFGDNQISDISPLSGLTALEALFLGNFHISNLPNNEITDISPLAGLTALRELLLNNNRILDVSPLSGLTALERLHLNDNRISDISPLSGLTALEQLFLGGNQISGISPLSGLTALKLLYLGSNRMVNVSPLSGLTALERLHLNDNRISDISPLAGLTALEHLSLFGNRISNLGPLVSNAGLDDGDTLYLWDNPARGDRACSHVQALQRRGVTVSHGVTVWDEELSAWIRCPTPQSRPP